MTAPSIRVTEVDFITIPTADLTAAMDFYENTLGLSRSSVWQRDGEEPMGAELLAGEVTLSLIVASRLGIEFRPHLVPIALRVDDVEAARTSLQEAGVEFLADTLDTGVCHMAHFKDPDGNVLMLHRRYAPKHD